MFIIHFPELFFYISAAPQNPCSWAPFPALLQKARESENWNRRIKTWIWQGTECSSSLPEKHKHWLCWSQWALPLISIPCLCVPLRMGQSAQHLMGQCTACAARTVRQGRVVVPWEYVLLITKQDGWEFKGWESAPGFAQSPVHAGGKIWRA